MPRSCTPRKWTRCCASPATSRHSRPGRVKEPSVASQGGALAVHDLLPAWPLLSAFLVASLILAVTPGPGVFYIVTRSVAQGRSCGLASAAGVALGNLGNAIGASLGLAVLFAGSSVAFAVVKYAAALGRTRGIRALGRYLTGGAFFGLALLTAFAAGERAK